MDDHSKCMSHTILHDAAIVSWKKCPNFSSGCLLASWLTALPTAPFCFEGCSLKIGLMIYLPEVQVLQVVSPTSESCLQATVWFSVRFWLEELVMRKEGCSADDVKYCSTVLGPSVWFHWATRLIKELPLWGMTMSIELYRRQQLIPCTLFFEAEFSCQCFLQAFSDSLLRSRMAIRLLAACFHFCEFQAWRRILQEYEMWFSNFLWNPSPFSKQE